jgi:hypothetical protein
MTPEDKKFLSRTLKNELQHVDDLWNEKTDNHVGTGKSGIDFSAKLAKDYAYIIGYLIGMVKGVIYELDGDEEDSNNPT